MDCANTLTEPECNNLRSPKQPKHGAIPTDRKVTGAHDAAQRRAGDLIQTEKEINDDLQQIPD
jgi:hypothetical protein